MSNLKNSRNTASQPLNDKAIDPNSRHQRWNTIQTDLLSALETWDELSQSETKPSPEEEQLQKIKSIIGQLREKLEQF